MPEVSTLIVAGIAGIAMLIGLWIWHRYGVSSSGEPEIELERLVNCKSCGSLIPEGVRRCAFCGAWQRGQRPPESKCS